MKPATARMLAILIFSSSLCIADETTLRYADVQYSEDDMLPIRSKSLTPGSVQHRLLSAKGLPPFFLVGDDVRSRNWLQQRRHTLIKMNAVGLVVNVESKTSLNSLRRVASGLTLTPVSADDLAHRLELRHYPVLITGSSIEQ